MIRKITLGIASLGVMTIGAYAQVVATDNYETGTIAYGYNGGSGYGALTYVTGANGGVFGANASSGGRQLDGTQSLGEYSGSAAGNSQVAGRSITSPVTNGIFNLDARWDITNTGDTFTGINLASSLGTAFGTGELLSFGLTSASNSQFLITDGSGTHDLSVGTDTELRGGIFNFNIAFNTTADTYALTVTDKSDGQTGTISGALEGTPGSFGAFKLQNVDTDGGNQNLICDNTVVTAVPEPGTILSFLSGSSLLGGLMFIRRRRA